MKITIDVKENKEGKITVKVNELKRTQKTKDTEFNASINVFNAICKALKEMEGK